MKSRDFINGALVLAVAGILAKFIGFFFKVPLTALIGLEGLGLYNYPYFLYTAMLSISITGLPIAVSKLVSEKIAFGRYEEAHHIFKVILLLMLFVGTITSAALIASSQFIVGIFWPKEAYYSLMGLALSPLFLALLSVFRGYFQGMQLMVPTAISQIFEALGRLVMGLGLAYFLLDQGIALAAGGAAFGTTAGALLSLLTMIIMYIRYRSGFPAKRIKKPRTTHLQSSKKIVKDVLAIAIPISIGALASSMMSLIDSLMSNARLLTAGFSVSTASALYGQLGVASTLINFPLTITMAIAVSLVPSISEVKARGNYHEIRKRIDYGVKMAVYIGMPASIGLIMLADPILKLIFPTIVGGKALLQLLSAALFFMSLNQIFISVLQGLGRVAAPVKNLFIGSVIKIIISYVLIAHPSYNIQGAAIGTIVAYILIMLLNYIQVRKSTRFKIQTKDTLIYPLIGSLIMAVAVNFTFEKAAMMTNSNAISTVLSICVGVGIYGLILIKLGGITQAEIRMLLKK